MKGGATSARIVLPDRVSDNAPAVVETQYGFPSRKPLRWNPSFAGCSPTRRS